MKIVVNPYAKDRHLPEMPNSHFDGNWDELCELIQSHFDGSDKPVTTVSVPAEKFFSAVTKLNEESNLKVKFAARRRGENPYVQTTVVGGEKLPAASVEIILYSHDLLVKEGEEVSAGSDWEVISINAWATTKDGEAAPQSPVSMARNFLDMEGGTKRDYSAKEFAEAIIFWSQHAKIDTKG